MGDRAANGEMLIWAATWNKFQILKNLIEREEVDPSYRDKNGRTAFIIAAEWGHAEILNFLMTLGIDINHQAESSLETALMAAAYQGEAEICKILRKAGAKLEMKDSKGNTVLSLAALNKKISSVNYLCDQGANLQVQNNSGKFLIHQAVSVAGVTPVVDYLLGKGADVNVKDKSGDTPIMIAIDNRDIPMVKHLVERGANLTTDAGLDMRAIVQRAIERRGGETGCCKEKLKMYKDIDAYLKEEIKKVNQQQQEQEMAEKRPKEAAAAPAPAKKGQPVRTTNKNKKKKTQPEAAMMGKGESVEQTGAGKLKAGDESMTDKKMPPPSAAQPKASDDDMMVDTEGQDHAPPELTNVAMGSKYQDCVSKVYAALRDKLRVATVNRNPRDAMEKGLQLLHRKNEKAPSFFVHMFQDDDDGAIYSVESLNDREILEYLVDEYVDFVKRGLVIEEYVMEEEEEEG